MKYLMILVVVALAGCGAQGKWVTDQKERQRIFKECLGALPAGPSSTMYNDWAEVVQKCEDAAYRQSQVWVDLK
jgi:hypothetical protein